MTKQKNYYSVLINWGDSDGTYAWAGFADDEADAETKAYEEMGIDPHSEEIFHFGYGDIIDTVEGGNIWSAGHAGNEVARLVSRSQGASHSDLQKLLKILRPDCGAGGYETS